jgi:hypothetical protein
LEDIQHQDPVQSRPYMVIREYKVLRGSNTQPTSEITAQINFVPPDTKTYKIIQAKGDSRGERMVRELLDRETDSAKKVRSDEISRTNFDFVFLDERTLGSFLSTFWGSSRSGRISTCCAGKSGWMRALPHPTNSRSTRQEPSFWITNLHLTMQFAQLNGMWVPVSFDAIAIRFLGDYTFAGLNISSSESTSAVPK